MKRDPAGRRKTTTPVLRLLRTLDCFRLKDTPEHLTRSSNIISTNEREKRDNPCKRLENPGETGKLPS